MTMALALVTINKVGKLIPRLASEHDGEVVATARAISRVLLGVGASLHDLVNVIQEPKIDTLSTGHTTKPKRKSRNRDAPLKSVVPFAEVLRIGSHLINYCNLNDREREFILSLIHWATKLRGKSSVTEKQAAWWAVIISTYIQSEV